MSKNKNSNKSNNTNEVPVEVKPTAEMPTVETPTETFPLSETPTAETPTEATPFGWSSVETPTPTEMVPVETASKEETPLVTPTESNVPDATSPTAEVPVNAETPAERKLVKFNVPVSYRKPEEFWVNTSRNIRTVPGLTAFGVTADGDSYDVAGMVTDLIEADGIVRTPVVAVITKHPETGADVLEVLQGNRRILGAQALAAQPNVSDAVRKNLKRIPCFALRDLTEAQRTEMIFDQDNKDFLDSEVVRDVFSLRQHGWSYDQIVMGRTKPLLRIMTNGKNLGAEIRSIGDPIARKKKITVGMHGTIGNGLLDGFALGQWMQKTILQSYMLRDGLIAPDGPQVPYFNALKNLQGRVGALKKAKSADGVKFNPLVLIEGTEFKRLCDSYRKADYEPDAKKDGEPSKKMLNKSQLDSLDAGIQSRIGKAILQRVRGEKVPELQAEDATAVMLQTKVQLAEAMLDQLTDDAATVVKHCLLNPNAEDFQTWLEANIRQD